MIDQWDDLTRKMGYWVDLENPYITYEREYIESLWWSLKKLYDRKLLYKGYTIQPYSPAAGTGLSSHELNLPGCYKDVKDTSVVAQFKVKKDNTSSFLFSKPTGDVYILAWTTTPWTLPSNTALAVGEKIDPLEVQQVTRPAGYTGQANMPSHYSTQTQVSQAESIYFMNAEGKIQRYLKNTHGAKTQTLVNSIKDPNTKIEDKETLADFMSAEAYIKLEEYAKDNKLKFQKIEDLLKILSYYETILDK